MSCDLRDGPCSCVAWHVMTVDELRSQYRDARDALTRRAGEPVVLWTSDGLHATETPARGWVHRYIGVTYSADLWYPTEERARAAEALRPGTVVHVEGYRR